MTHFIKRRLSITLPKDLLIDLEDRIRAEAVKAHEMIRDHAGLDQKRSREAEGQARFRMWEHGVEEVGLLHGGKLLAGGAIPNTDAKVFQPFLRFETDGQGLILGLAAMPEPKTLPIKNKSRTAGIGLNYNLSPRLDLDDAGDSATIGDIFAILLVARDRDRAGQIEEIAIGVVDSNYETFLSYDSLDGFIGGHGEIEPTPPDTPEPGEAVINVTLKKVVEPFVPPEAPKPEGEDKDAEGK
jgi:hypothetical protein